jgi:hypothetical protein
MKTALNAFDITFDAPSQQPAGNPNHPRYSELLTGPEAERVRCHLPNQQR